MESKTHCVAWICQVQMSTHFLLLYIQFWKRKLPVEIWNLVCLESSFCPEGKQEIMFKTELNSEAWV